MKQRLRPGRGGHAAWSDRDGTRPGVRCAGRCGDGPDSYEVDVVTTSGGPDDFWAIEAKHRPGAITRGMVERFATSVRAVGAAHNLSFAHLWIVAPRGIRPDALEVARRGGAVVRR